MAVRFSELDVTVRLNNRRKLAHYIESLISLYRKDVVRISLQYIFCTDTYLLQINQQFLGHDTLTDIITFDLSEKKKELSAEIYISIERVTENAKMYEQSYNKELHRVIFHGALHLCGLGDKTKKEQVKMRDAENESIASYFKTMIS